MNQSSLLVPVRVNDDIFLVEKCRRGESQAFDQLVIKYQKRIFNLTYRMLGNYEEANDLAQETFIRAYKKLGSFRKEASFYTWLYRLASNLCKNKLRQWQRQGQFQTQSLHNPVGDGQRELINCISDQTDGPDKILEKKDLEQCVQRAIDSLQEDHRLVVILRDIQGLSYQEVAAILGCQEGTVKSRLHRARDELKERLKDVI